MTLLSASRVLSKRRLRVFSSSLRFIMQQGKIHTTEKKLIEVMIFQGESSRVVEELSQVMLDDVCLTTLLLVVVKVDLALGFLKLLT